MGSNSLMLSGLKLDDDKGHFEGICTENCRMKERVMQEEVCLSYDRCCIYTHVARLMEPDGMPSIYM